MMAVPYEEADPWGNAVSSAGTAADLGTPLDAVDNRALGVDWHHRQNPENTTVQYQHTHKISCIKSQQ